MHHAAGHVESCKGYDGVVNAEEITARVHILGWDAFYDLFLKLPYEGIGAMVGDEEDSDFSYQRDDPNGRYEEGEAKFWNHVGRLIPYYKSIWAIENPYQAMENYMFGRKMNSR